MDDMGLSDWGRDNQRRRWDGGLCRMGCMFLFIPFFYTLLPMSLVFSCKERKGRGFTDSYLGRVYHTGK